MASFLLILLGQRERKKITPIDLNLTYQTKYKNYGYISIFWWRVENFVNTLA